MAIALDLPDELERDLTQEATRLGVSLHDYLLRVLADRRAPIAIAAARSGAELVSIWASDGLVGSRPDIEDPVRYAREIRDRSQNRRHG